MIIGLGGNIGSGKGAVSAVLKSMGYKVIVFGDIVRKETAKSGMEPNRKNTDKVSKERTKDNPDYWREEVYKRIDDGKYVIDGIRYPEDVAFFRKKIGRKFKLLFVTAPKNARFERLKKRGRIGDPQTLKEFEKQEEQQKILYHVDKIEKMADTQVENSGTMRELENKVRYLIEKH